MQERLLKNNFERLESLFQDSLEEVNQVKNEYEARLIEANDKYRQAKSENEELKEKVDVLFKLGRSYINRKEMSSPPSQSEDVGKEEDPDRIDVVETEETSGENLQAWSKGKLRGFKRVSPSNPPEPNLGKAKPASADATTRHGLPPSHNQSAKT